MNIKEQFGWLLSKILYEWNPRKKRQAIKFYKQFIAKGDLCFDVGAHMGDRSQSWLKIGAEVVGIEPQPRFSNYLENKFSSFEQYHNEQIGIGSTFGSMDLMISSMYPTLSSLSGEKWAERINNSTSLSIKFDKTISIEVQTLDILIQKYGKPKFIKVDVEGYEEEVLKGLTQKIEFLSFEFLSFNMEGLKKCIYRLKELGYSEFNWSYREQYKMVLPKWSISETLIESIGEYKTGTFSGDVYTR